MTYRLFVVIIRTVALIALTLELPSPSFHGFGFAEAADDTWSITAIDTAGDVGRNASIAVDSNNKVHISYWDFTNNDLKYATNASGLWVTAAIDTVGNVGGSTSIAVDANNKVHIAYLHQTNGDLKYATNVSGAWTTTTVDDSDGYNGMYTSIAVDANNKLHISYIEYINRAIKYATNTSGSWATTTIADVAGYDTDTNIAVDSNNKVHISYRDFTNSDLKYATNASGSWVTTVFAAGGSGSSIAVDSANNVHITYYDHTNGDLKYAMYAQLTDTTTGIYVTSDLWIRAVIQTEETGPIEAVWQKGGEDTTSRGDRVIWGHFYASPSDVTWGSENNPDLFVKIWFDVSGRVDVNYFHVSVPEIEVYSDYPYDGTPDEHGITTMSRRYIRQYYQNGESNMDENYEDGNPPSGYSPTGNPSGYSTINDLRIGSIINTVEKGPIDALWRLGGQDTTARGDQVVWGHFYASPSDVTWGSQNNPDLFVKIWFDVGGRTDVNFFHVSVPDIEVYSDLPDEGTYDQHGTTIMDNRYIRHEY